MRVFVCIIGVMGNPGPTYLGSALVIINGYWNVN